jgi:ABC-type glutathione transport system ATPase component
VVRIDDLTAVCKSQEVVRFVREPELPEGGVVALTGDSGSGKSTLATAWMRDSIAAGRAALILNRENPRRVAADRMTRLGLHDSPLLR